MLEEITRLESDYVRRLYYRELLRTASLDAATVARVVARAGGDIRSDFEQAQVLLSVVKTHDTDAASRPAFLAAADTIHSDFEQTRALAALVRAEPR